MPSRRKRGEKVGKAAEAAEALEAVDVGARVRVYPGTDRELTGTVVEDFGDEAGHAVLVGDQQIACGARRWAVAVTDGSLVFVDDHDIAAAAG